MLTLGSGFNYYFCAEPVTLRYRHKGLRHYIKSQLHRDPTNGDVYIFLSKECRRIRLYYYHHQGEILSEKILNASHFVEPVFDEKKGVYHISWESFVYSYATGKCPSVKLRRRRSHQSPLKVKSATRHRIEFSQIPRALKIAY